MSYVSAFIDNDDIVVIERNGTERIIKKVSPEYVFYTLDQYGDYKTIFGDRCTKHIFDNRKEFYGAMRQFPHNSIYESDINPVNRYLSKNYDFNVTPTLNVAFYDIEVAYTKETRFSNPDKAENQIISVAVYQSWTNKMVVLALAPPTMSYQQCVDICKKIEADTEDTVCLMMKNEVDLIKYFFELIEDSDVISGWNSESYDFKYIYNRVRNIMGQSYTTNLCIGGKEPKEREVFNEKTKRRETVFSPIGRVHLDYMILYKKYTYSELSSYKLDNVAYIELNERKVEYHGTLDHLYKHDFELFLRYNIKDTYLVKRIDDEKKFIDLTNLLAHNNGVLLETTLGTVGITEQAIINQGHYYSEECLVFPKRERREQEGDEIVEEIGAAGAYVAVPKKGIKRLVAGNDINSLYPSVIRALNMSPETLVAHINSEGTDLFMKELVDTGKAESYAEAWQPYFSTFEFDKLVEGSEENLILEFNRSDETIEAPAKKLKQLIYGNNDWCVSANGTIFRKDKEGIIPALLSRWYAERKTMQAKAEEWEIKMVNATDPIEKEEATKNYKYWDQRQMAKKINLNALYGALLNKHCRFFDKRLGQSTTLTGRNITRHMSSFINKEICGVYDHNGEAIIYGDTDSVTGDTNIETDYGTVSIEELFHICSIKWENGKKEYAADERIKTISYDMATDSVMYKPFNYVYRHNTKKVLWRITDEEGETIEVTEDHSVMIERDNRMLEIKPGDLLETDVLIKVCK